MPGVGRGKQHQLDMQKIKPNRVGKLRAYLSATETVGARVQDICTVYKQVPGYSCCMYTPCCPPTITPTLT